MHWIYIEVWLVAKPFFLFIFATINLAMRKKFDIASALITQRERNRISLLEHWSLGTWYRAKKNAVN